jgi:hypothetical protein
MALEAGGIVADLDLGTAPEPSSKNNLTGEIPGTA